MSQLLWTLLLLLSLSMQYEHRAFTGFEGEITRVNSNAHRRPITRFSDVLSSIELQIMEAPYFQSKLLAYWYSLNQVAIHPKGALVAFSSISGTCCALAFYIILVCSDRLLNLMWLLEYSNNGLSWRCHNFSQAPWVYQHNQLNE